MCCYNLASPAISTKLIKNSFLDKALTLINKVVLSYLSNELMLNIQIISFEIFKVCYEIYKINAKLLAFSRDVMNDYSLYENT